MAQPLAPTLYDALGGGAAVKTVVGDFYNRVLKDPNLSGFFNNTDMVHQTKQQVAFITKALGGPDSYDGRDMRTAHASLGISSFHFGLVAGHLSDALAAAGVSEEKINQVLELVGPLQDEIVTVPG